MDTDDRQILENNLHGIKTVEEIIKEKSIATFYSIYLRHRIPVVIGEVR